METKEKVHPTVRKETKRKRNTTDLFSPLLIILIVFSFLRIVTKFAVNAPNFDDFAYLEYTLGLINSNDFLSFIENLLSKHNGHGVITAKLVFWLNYLIEGEVNFRHLILASTVLVVLIFAFFIWLLRKNSLPIFYSLPIALLLFNPLYYENIMWAAASWQYTASIASCLAMYFLLTRQKNWAFISALVLGFLTTYTNGNGIIGFGLGAVIIVPQKKYTHLTIWLIISLLTGIFHYTHSPSALGTKDGHAVIPFFITLISFMATSAYYLRQNINDLILVGTLISGVFLMVLIRSGFLLATNSFSSLKKKIINYFEANPVNLTLLALIAWFFLTGLCVAWTRGVLQFAIVSRYMIYSVINFVILYSLLLIVAPSRYKILVGLAGIGIGILFQFCSYLYCVPDIINYRNSLWADVYNLKNHRHVSGKVETMNNKFTRAIFDESINKGIYVFPEIPIPDNNAELFKIQNPIVDSLNTFIITKDTLKSYSGILITSIANDKITIDESNPTNSMYIALKDKKNNQIHLINAKPTANTNRKNFLKNRNHFNPGIVASVYEDNVEPGWYTIGILTFQNNSSTLTFTNKEVEIGKIY